MAEFGSSEAGKKGGRARAEKLSKEERSNIARTAAKARWENDAPRATHGDPEHPLRIGDIEIPCYVLENGQRVISQRALQLSIGLNVSGGAQRIIKILTTLESKGLSCKGLRSRIESPLVFRPPSGPKAHGFEATVLADLCILIEEADENGLLRANQSHLAKQCKILMRGFAKVGIIALVDEATGYQYDRSRRSLEEILETYLQNELGKWMKRFPDEFYTELFRLKGLKYIPFPVKKPQYVGHWTNDLVYKRIAPGVLGELRDRVPRNIAGRRKAKFHQWFTEDVGHPKLQEHLASVIALMKSCDDWDDFHSRLDKALPKYKPMPLFDGTAALD